MYLVGKQLRYTVDNEANKQVYRKLKSTSRKLARGL